MKAFCQALPRLSLGATVFRFVPQWTRRLCPEHFTTTHCQAQNLCQHGLEFVGVPLVVCAEICAFIL